MYVKDAVRVFGSRAAIAEHLKGKRHRSAVYQWKELVPLGAAFVLADESKGALRVDMTLYMRQHDKKRRHLAKIAKRRH